MAMCGVRWMLFRDWWMDTGIVYTGILGILLVFVAIVAALVCEHG